VRPACALPYELYCDGHGGVEEGSFAITMAAGKKVFGDHSAGSPFAIYSYGKEMTVRNYAVVAGDRLTDSFPLKDPGQGYDYRVYGPNGFFRVFTGGRNDPALSVLMEYEFGKDQQPTGRLMLKVVNEDNKPCKLVLTDNAYKETLDRPGDRVLGPKDTAQIVLDPGKHGGWYDWSLRVAGVKGFEKRYAGRVETGKESISDPAMG
jgi:phospholipase C